jgi:pimeloyl-ACP methyl ester carboxylesterase
MAEAASAPLPALGICLEDYPYPYPVRFPQLANDLQPVAMAYMDIPPTAEPNGQTVILFHGKAFGCYYFQNVIEALTGAGYRVVAPDQIGWYPDRVTHLVLDPDPKIWEPLADVLVRVTLSPDYQRWARAAALAFQMIYQQPVRYEYHQIAPPVLLIVGAEDHVVPLGQYATPADVTRLGDFPAQSAAAAAAQDIPQAKRVVVPDCGHIPHLEQPSQFLAELLPFLAS